MLPQPWYKSFIVRTCGLYSPASTARNFVATMLDRGSNNAILRVVDDQHCSPTYIPHLVQALCFF